MYSNHIDNYYIYFFKVKKIEDSQLFDKFSRKKFYFTYFFSDNDYYLFFYGKRNSNEFDQFNSLFKEFHVIQNLDKKKRLIRSLRGFFKYAIEIMKKSKDKKIIETNLYSLFWNDLEKIISQNRKKALLDFLVLTASRGPDFSNYKSHDYNQPIQKVSSQSNHQISFLTEDLVQKQDIAEEDLKLRNEYKNTDKDLVKAQIRNNFHELTDQFLDIFLDPLIDKKLEKN